MNGLIRKDKGGMSFAKIDPSLLFSKKVRKRWLLNNSMVISLLRSTWYEAVRQFQWNTDGEDKFDEWLQIMKDSCK